MVLGFALINAHYRSPIDMNEALLNDAERNTTTGYWGVTSARSRVEAMLPCGAAPTGPFSPAPAGEVFGFARENGRGLRPSRWTTISTREAVAKVLGMVREISKVLNSDLEAADRNAFSHYAVDLLEETAGNVLGGCPRKRWRLRNRRRTLAKLRSPKRWKPFSFNELRLGRPRIGSGQMPSRPIERPWRCRDRHGIGPSVGPCVIIPLFLRWCHHRRRCWNKCFSCEAGLFHGFRFVPHFLDANFGRKGVLAPS